MKNSVRMKIAALIFSLFFSMAHAENLMLYYTNYCPYSQKVLTYLREIHKTVPMKEVENNQVYKDELLKVGGKLQVPCLIVDGKAIYNSDAIIDWMGSHQDKF